MEGSNGVTRPTPADADNYMGVVANTTRPIRVAPCTTRTPILQDTPSNGTYDLRTGPERAQAQLDDLAGRLRRLEAQHSQEIRMIAERLQHVEYLLEQFSGDGR